MTVAERNRLSLVPDESFGFADAFSAARASLDENARVLRDFATTRRADAGAPFSLDSRTLAVLAYKEALSRVRRRFWTTTFLGSGFWCDLDEDILDANVRMTIDCRRAGGEVRRLFLLALTPEEEIQRIQDERVLLRKCDDRDGLARLDRRMANLADNIALLRHHGCDVRVSCDPDRLYQNLPADLDVDPRDTELALYDDWRFDLFRGGLLGSIQCVQGYTPAMARFAEFRDALAERFEALWATSTPMADFLERLRRNTEESVRRIDYPVSWLVRYDHALSREDEALKLEELSAVRVDLIRLDRWGGVRRFLDVGTCTARYPLTLAGAVVPDGAILGVDNDIDCVRFARAKVRRALGDQGRVRIERHDFRSPEAPDAGRFDLVTCMLGTLSHFERGPASGPPFDDPFQHALEKFARLLDDDGLLFFTVWTEEACRDLRYLGIYDEADKQRLAQAAIRPEELMRRIACAGLTALAPIRLQDRLDLYRCERHRPPSA